MNYLYTVMIQDHVGGEIFPTVSLHSTCEECFEEIRRLESIRNSKRGEDRCWTDLSDCGSEDQVRQALIGMVENGVEDDGYPSVHVGVCGETNIVITIHASPLG